MRRKSTFLFRKKVQPNGADWCEGRQQGGSYDIRLKIRFPQIQPNGADKCRYAQQDVRSEGALLYKKQKKNQTAQIGAEGGNRVAVATSG